ncbi:elongation factor G [Desulfosalsimonas propionicica]|uniref:Elongation factor G n=1 Tax=Desulfosalsimonas propionicica TaxID=332175 RepID=A0A7W0C9I9_9BACT|nr:elongation factor G [Desulfosalsimonas propionicica]MBA2881647.1 elongation factor G [Desulfosalsimonas propionicica]
MSQDIKHVRNIGISAHIDSGKTTLTERILYLTKRIHKIHEVRGKDGVGATMDSMALEKERGITIASAATYCTWGGHEINIIDTPGHVDFTMEVERSLRVLDGAILVLCAVGGVQSQSITVDLQMKRYNIPSIAFINKCDRSGANPFRVIDQLREKLGHNAVALQLPMGLESYHSGVVDLISMKAMYFEGDQGQHVKTDEIPEDLVDTAMEKREELLDAASMFSDELTEAILDEAEVSETMLRKAIRKGALRRELTPVLMGSAYKNKGVHPLLNAVCDYLPSPDDVETQALDITKGEEPVRLTADNKASLVALAFKLEDTPYGQLTYIRTYQGALDKGDTIYNVRTGKKIKVGRIVRMHADKMEDVETIPAGFIAALFGIDCASGDTFTEPGMNLSMSSMYIPEPVITLAVKPADYKSETNMSKALNRFTKEDPTFQTHFNSETGETLISGMGELHLEIYLERMKREYNASIIAGEPQVAYRETITQQANFDYTHKKQTGGAGQFGRVMGYMEPVEDEFEFQSKITGGAIPTHFIPACEKGFAECMKKGPWMKYPVTGVKLVLTDGGFHSVDSSEMAFQAAARGAFQQAYPKAKPVLLEPVMKVVVETPDEFQGNVMGSLNQRRGIIIGAHDEGISTVIEAHVPLAEMFGYSTVLRSLTQGKAQFTMEFEAYKEVPKSVLEEIAKKNEQASKGGKS